VSVICRGSTSVCCAVGDTSAECTNSTTNVCMGSSQETTYWNMEYGVGMQHVPGPPWGWVYSRYLLCPTITDGCGATSNFTFTDNSQTYTVDATSADNYLNCWYKFTSSIGGNITITRNSGVGAHTTDTTQ
jgi:hypothetical protein